MPSILVTGGAGFIGSSFVRGWLAEESDSVVTLDKLSYAGNQASLATIQGSLKHTFVQGDIADRPLVDEILLRHQPRAVVHLAAATHVDRSIDTPGVFVETNTVGTFKLLEAVTEYWRTLPAGPRDAFRFLHVSTDEVFGSMAEGAKADESTRYAPTSPYAASKAGGDHFVRAFAQTYGLPTLLTCCTNNFGPFQYPEKLVPLMILNAFDGRPMPVYGDGQQVRDWLHVDDHVRALRRVLAAGRVGESYNIAGGNERTNQQVVEMICDLVDCLFPGHPYGSTRRLIQHVADRPGHDRRYALDDSKLRRELRWQPEVDFNLGLEDTVRWYVENRIWSDDVMRGKYDRERLGLSQADA